jgi:hypothetical protein
MQRECQLCYWSGEDLQRGDQQAREDHAMGKRKIVEKLQKAARRATTSKTERFFGGFYRGCAWRKE